MIQPEASLMALENVTQEIYNSAEARAVEIGKATQVEIATIIKDADEKIAEMKEKEDKRLKEAIERLGRQEQSSAELDSKKVVLAKKKEILSDAFDEVLLSLENAPTDKKLEQYKAMVNLGKDIVKNPKALMSENDPFTADELGVSSVEKTSKIKGGLILQSEDGSTEVDLQYSTILKAIWDKEIGSVSDILFG